MNRKLFLICFGLMHVCIMHAQLCTTPGQTPTSAVLVCGAETFTVHTVQFCGQTAIPTPCPPGTYQNLNPSFFRMACYSSGTLGFTITPTEANANFDWQLFDVTNTNPQDIFTNPNLFLACNWSDDPGETGASVDGTSLAVCKGGGQPLFSKMPDLQQGHTYLLMVSNQSASVESFQLTFTGGSASITDALDPHLRFARLNCEGDKVILRLNKEVKCPTLAADGSDFSLSGGVSILSASPAGCVGTLGTDSIILTLDQTLLNGNYTLTINNGSDGNTLVDMCGREIPEAETIPLQVLPPAPTPLDSIFPVKCAPAYIDLVFRKPMRCNTIAANGSDFIISGPQPVNISSITYNCNVQGTSPIVRLNFSSPLYSGGDYQVTVTTGTDGNTLADECGLLTAIGSSKSFSIKDTVSADFTYQVLPSCKENTVSYLHPGGNGITNWQWDAGAPVNNIPDPVIRYQVPVQYNVKLTVTNGFCTDTYTQSIAVDNQLKADFDIPELLCPGETLIITNNSSGTIDTWDWSFGNGNSSDIADPPTQVFLAGNGERQYVIRLIAGNSNLNCSDTATHLLTVPVNCIVAVPSAFTPNNDGRNDYFYPLNAHKARDLDFKIFNRFGQAVFTSKNSTSKWDGRVNGLPQATGVYAWFLIYTDIETGKRISRKGTLLLIR